MQQNPNDSDTVNRRLYQIEEKLLDHREVRIDRLLTISATIIASISAIFAVFAILTTIAGGYFLSEYKKTEDRVEKLWAESKANSDKFNLRDDAKLRGATPEESPTDSTDNRRLENKPDVSQLALAARRGDYVSVTTDSFTSVVDQSGQINAADLVRFIMSASEILSDDSRNFEHRDRWDLTVGSGEVFVFRTANQDELDVALKQLTEVLEAIAKNKNLPDIRVIVRGTEKFFDITGISGVGSRAWIGFDLRGYR